jgi:hypothetical protein
MKVSLPGSFVQDLRDVVLDSDDEPCVSLGDKIEGAEPVRCGRGYRLIIDATEDEARIILREAKYRAEYWGTNAYGVERKESARASAALRVADALSKALAN